MFTNKEEEKKNGVIVEFEINEEKYWSINR